MKRKIIMDGFLLILTLVVYHKLTEQEPKHVVLKTDTAILTEHQSLPESKDGHQNNISNINTSKFSVSFFYCPGQTIQTTGGWMNYGIDY